MRTLLVISLLLFPFATQAEEKPATMTVHGEAVTKVAPDQVTLPVTIREENTDIKTAKTKHDEKVIKLIRLANELGVEKGNVQTSYTSVSPLYDYDRTTPRLRAYQVQTSLNFTLNNIPGLGDFMNKVIGLGITDLGSVSYSLHDEDRIKQDTLEKALENAHEKALHLAATAKVALDKPLDIIEGEAIINRPPVRPLPFMMHAVAATSMAMASAPELPSGLMEIRQAVTVTYQLKQ